MTSHYLNQWWPSSPTHICGTRGRWVKACNLSILTGICCSFIMAQFNKAYIYGLMQKRRNYSVLAKELRLSCIDPLICITRLQWVNTCCLVQAGHCQKHGQVINSWPCNSIVIRFIIKVRLLQNACVHGSRLSAFSLPCSVITFMLCKCHDVSNCWSLGCLFNSLFWITLEEETKLCIADPLWGESMTELSKVNRSSN